MIEKTEHEPFEGVIEGVGVYMAHAVALTYLSKLKKEHERLNYLLAECKVDLGRQEWFGRSDQKKIDALRVELKSCKEQQDIGQTAVVEIAKNQRLTAENRSPLLANAALAEVKHKAAKLDDVKDQALIAAQQGFVERDMRIEAGIRTIVEQRETIEEQDRVIGLCGSEVRALKNKYDTVWFKLNKAQQAIELNEIEISMRRDDSRTLAKVIELFNEFGTMCGMVATRDLRCIRDLLTDHACCPITPAPAVNKTIASAKQIMAEAVALMEAKNADYGDSWRMMRTPSITDQILVKVHRIRAIEESPDDPKVSEGIESEYRDILNYCVFAMIQINERSNDKEPKVNGNKTLIIDEGKLKPLHCMCKQVPWVV